MRRQLSRCVRWGTLLVVFTFLWLAAGPGSIGATRLTGISEDELFPGARFDPAIPTQEEVLGFLPGHRPIRHAELLQYLRDLAELSPRAELRTYSSTHEERPMVLFIVSDEETMTRLDDFKAGHARRTDPRGRPAEEDAALVRDAKAVAWIAYGIHGDELSSVDAAAAMAYWLVAGEDERAKQLRRELVILIDPCENPDGRERFLTQLTSFAHATPNPDQEDLSHTTVWPWGRGNHYLFDLNRDWFSLVHPESRRSVLIAQWNPQVVVDSHEMGSSDSYLFSPPRHPFNPHLPAYESEWADRFAADQAKALDARGYGYYTREWNEEFFPGYGSSWASYLGAIGILYEMSGTEGTLVQRRGGSIRTYGQAVEHQVASSVANLSTLADHRAELLGEFVAGRREVIRQGADGPVGAWVLADERNPERVDALVRILQRQGIEALASETAVPKIDGLRDARTGQSVDAKELPPGAWMVPTDQPAGLLVRVLLDPHVPMDAKFFREEREHLERGKGTRLYETTSWALPLAYGIEAYWTPERPPSGWVEREIVEEKGTLVSASQVYAYLMEGTSDPSMPALAHLLQEGIAVHLAEKPFRAEGRSYDRGTLLIKREGNPEDLGRRLNRVARRWNVEIRAVTTAKAEAGPDLGGGYFHALVAPRVGIWSGAPVSPPDYGALWHLLDLHARLRFSGLDISRFARTDLARYNVLIFPPINADAGAYREILGEKGVQRLKDWVHAGGTAIGIAHGAEFLSDEKIDLTRARLRRQALESYPPAVLGPSAAEVMAGGAFHAVGLHVPPRSKDDGKQKEKKAGAGTKRASLYDVAPLLGPGAAPFAEGFEQGTPVDLKPVNLVDWLKPTLPPSKSKPDKKDLERADERLRRFSTYGTFLRADLDRDVWLNWGVAEELPVLVRSSRTIVAKPPVQVAARFADLERLHLGGLLWPEAAGRMARTAYATRESVGRGQVVLFASEPEFRGWTLGTRRLLLNAILYGPGMGTDWSTPW